MASMWCVFGVLASVYAASALRVGVGIADVTGPPAEIILNGYAHIEQVSHGIHLRQFARSYVLEDDKEGGQRLTFVTVDSGMIGDAVKREIIKKLKNRYGDLYTKANVIISGTHSHSTPGGYMEYFLYDVPVLGFIEESFVAMTVGIYESIVMAHSSLAPARMLYGQAELLDANINRSPKSYLKNPPEERAKYQYDVDKILAQVRFVSPSDQIIGVINWFPVHPTSMNNTNKLVSSDNMGYASILMEKELNGQTTHPGKGKIVCAFSSTNLGDVSPNTKGPRCEFSGDVCDQGELQCKLPGEKCFASGPGKDMFESTKIIATKIFDTAMNVLRQPGEDLTGSIGIKQQFVDMPKQDASLYDPVTETFNSSSRVTGCVPAMGVSFGAGTTDGQGLSFLDQGTTSSTRRNRLLEIGLSVIVKPTEEDISCHAPKPILLPIGRMNAPYQWAPNITSCTVAKIGGLVILGVPGEFTTMSGRRLRNVVQKASNAKKIVIAGLSNTYTSYIATLEEYQLQRYEGASTIYGPHTLNIYLDKYVELTKAIMADRILDPGPELPDLSDQLITLVPPVTWDVAFLDKDFGDCIKQPEQNYSYGDTVKTIFVAGHPRNNIRHGRSYANVEMLMSEQDDAWVVVFTDADWETKFIWKRTSILLGTSSAEIEWEIPAGTTPGKYRIHHYGCYKTLKNIYPYNGFSNAFTVS